MEEIGRSLDQPDPKRQRDRMAREGEPQPPFWFPKPQMEEIGMTLEEVERKRPSWLARLLRRGSANPR